LQIVQFNLLKKESKLKDFVETSDNPFDNGQSITGLGNKSSTRKLTESQKKMKKLKETIEQEKDKDIQAELGKGNIVTHERIRCMNKLAMKYNNYKSNTHGTAISPINNELSLGKKPLSVNFCKDIIVTNMQ
jgi:hypothetical protein